MRTGRWTFALALLAAAGGCGGSGTAPSPPAPATPSAPPSGVLQIGGQYQITQRELTDNCGGGGQPASVTATITHTPGSSSFSMRDSGGTTFNGTVQPNGDFSADGLFGPDSTGQTFTQQLQGRFTAGGFTATLSVRAMPRNCDFTRAWTGVKLGAPNEFP